MNVSFFSQQTIYDGGDGGLPHFFTRHYETFYNNFFRTELWPVATIFQVLIKDLLK